MTTSIVLKAVKLWPMCPARLPLDKLTSAISRGVEHLLRKQDATGILFLEPGLQSTNFYIFRIALGDWPQERVSGVFNRACGITYTVYSFFQVKLILLLLISLRYKFIC